MALFSKTKTAKTKKTDSSVVVAPVAVPALHSAKEVLRAPRITEKAGLLQARGVYVFNISTDATKRDIIAAVKKMYKVTPRSVRMVNVPEKSVRHMKSGRYGIKSGGKKAYVYLKQGDSITLA